MEKKGVIVDKKKKTKMKGKRGAVRVPARVARFVSLRTTSIIVRNNAVHHAVHHAVAVHRVEYAQKSCVILLLTHKTSHRGLVIQRRYDV